MIARVILAAATFLGNHVWISTKNHVILPIIQHGCQALKACWDTTGRDFSSIPGDCQRARDCMVVKAVVRSSVVIAFSCTVIRVEGQRSNSAGAEDVLGVNHKTVLWTIVVLNLWGASSCCSLFIYLLLWRISTSATKTVDKYTKIKIKSLVGYFRAHHTKLLHNLYIVVFQ